MAIVCASELDRALSGLRQSHARASAFAGDAFVGDHVISGLPPRSFAAICCSFSDGVGRHGVRRARHGMGRLAAAGGACPRKILRRVAPGEIALFPRHAEEFRDHAMHVGPGFRPQIADAGLDVDAAIGLDDEQAVKARGAAGVTADRHANAAHLRAVALAGVHFPFIPLELLGAAVERFLDERARRILLLARHERSERGFAFRGVHAPDGHLIHAEFPRGFREDRLHDRDSLHSAGRTLRSARGRVRQDGHSAPAHGLRLVKHRNDSSRRERIAHHVIRAVVADHEHVERRDAAFLGESDLHAARAGWGARGRWNSPLRA